MKVYYKRGEHIIIFFGSAEMKQGLGVLKALATYFKANFIFNVAEEVERDIQERLTYTQHYRLCEQCCTELDTRTDTYYLLGGGYRHLKCPELKERKQ